MIDPVLIELEKVVILGMMYGMAIGFFVFAVCLSVAVVVTIVVERATQLTKGGVQIEPPHTKGEEI